MRPVVIDALNVAWWCGAPPALRIPLALLAHLLERGVGAQLVFDANAPHQLAADADVYRRLIAHPSLAIEVASGTPADTTLLKLARTRDACIVTRDRFRDHRRRYRRIVDDPARLVAGGVTGDAIVAPPLLERVPLPSTAAEAWLRVEAAAVAPKWA